MPELRALGTQRLNGITVPTKVGTASASGPVSYVSQGAEPIDNSELLRVANDVLDGLKYSYAAVAASPTADVPANSVEATFKSALAAMGEARRARATAVAKPLVAASQDIRQRTFGRWGQFSADQIIGTGQVALADQMEAVPVDLKLVGLADRRLKVPVDRIQVEGGKAVLDLEGLGEFEDAEALRNRVDTKIRKAAASRVHAERLEEIWGRNFLPDEAYEPPVNDFEDADAAIPDRIAVDVRRVKCVDETNPEFWGSDEIGIGGTGIDESGDVTEINERSAGGGFDDGDQRWLGWNDWATFDLREPVDLKKGWPKQYRVIFILAEKDNGGLEDFLSTLYSKVRDRVKAAIEKAVAAGLSVYVGEAIATVIGKVVAWVVDKLIGWIINLFGDDIFPGAVSTMTHVHYNARFSINGTWGYLYSPVYQSHFYGHGGHYLLEYRWRLHY